MHGKGRWVFSKTALATVPAFDTCSVLRVRFRYDESNNQGAISMRHEARIADFGHGTCSPTLLIPPEVVDDCKIALSSDDALLPPHMLRRLPDNSVTSASHVSTLTLILKSSSIVLCPPHAKNLRPVIPDNADFSAFAKLCKATTIRIHFGRNQLLSHEPEQLQRFAAALDLSLLNEPIDYNRLSGGKGVQAATWRIFDCSPKSDDPPSYSESGPSPASNLDKRSRQLSNSPHAPTTKKARYRSPSQGSTTEPNTPSTCITGSPPMPGAPAEQTGTSIEASSPVVSLVVNLLESIPAHMLDIALEKLGYSRPPAPPVYVDLDSPSSSGQSRCASPIRAPNANLEELINCRVEQYVETRVASLINDKIESQVDKSLESLVNNKLPKLTEKAFGDYVDEVYENCQAAEIDVRDTTEDCLAELRQTVSEGLKELEATAQKQLDGISDAEQDVYYMALKKVDKKINDYRHQLLKQAQLIGQKPRTTAGDNIRSRHQSI